MKTVLSLLLFLPFGILAQTDGRLDPDFGNNGTLAAPFALARPSSTSAALQAIPAPNGGVTLLGTAVWKGQNTFCLTSVLANGNTDSTFGIYGRTYLNGFQVSSTAIVGFRIDPLHRILIGCQTGSGNLSAVDIYRFLPSGEPDTSFANRGVFNFQFENRSTLLAGIELQSDGRLLACGTSSNGNNTDFLTLRLNLQGQLDTTFNNTGLVITTFSTGLSNETAVAMQLMQDGRILVAGNFFNGLDDDFALVKLLSNGIPDTTFGNQGKMVLDYPGYKNRVLAIAEDPLSRILILGTINTSSYVVRLLANGQTDLSWGINGKFSVTGGYPWYYIAASGTSQVVVYNNNGCNRYNQQGLTNASYSVSVNVSLGAKPLASSSGFFLVGKKTLSADFQSMALIRLDTNMRVDTLFGNKGLLELSLSAMFYQPVIKSSLSAMAIQSDRKILLAGAASVAGSTQITVTRRLPNGSIDSSFGNYGWVMLDSGAALAIQPLSDQSMLVGGYAIINGIQQAVLLKLLPNGTPDASFGINGRQFHSMTYFKTIALQASGNIIAGGQNLARYLPNGQPDLSFGINGTDTNTVFANKCLVMPDQRLLVAGNTQLCRLLPNGKLDPEFTVFSYGYYTTRCDAGPGTILKNYSFEDLLLSPNGDILVTGYSNKYPLEWSCLYKSFALWLIGGEFRTGSLSFNEFGNGFQLVGKRYVYFLTNASSYVLKKKQPNGTADASFGTGGQITFPQNSIKQGWNATSGIPMISQWQEEGKLLGCFLRNDSILFSRHLLTMDTAFDVKVQPKAYGAQTDTFRLSVNTPLVPDSFYWWISDAPVYLFGTNERSPEPVVSFPNLNKCKYIGINATGYLPGGRTRYTNSPYAIKIGGRPIASFTYNRTQGTTLDTFEFVNTSSNFPDNTEWRFTPNKVNYIYASSQKVMVQFKSAGPFTVGLKVFNSLGSDSVYIDSLVLATSVGLSSVSENHDFVVYPNPTSGWLNIQTASNEPLELKLYSLSGELVMHETLAGSLETKSLKLPALADGLYFLSVSDGRSAEHLRIQIRRE